MSKTRAVVAGALLLLALGGVLIWTYLAQPAPGAPPAPTAPAIAERAPVPQVAPATPARVALAAPSKPPAAAAAPRSVYEALQDRLDAIAKAYVAGDAAGAERAMWPNHAVVRPNGQTLQRSELLGQWMTEWESFQQRRLSFAINEVYIEDEQVTAYVSMDLAAQVLGEDGEMHDFAALGLQKMTFQRERGVDVLERPIEYHGYEQTWDGLTFKPQ